MIGSSGRSPICDMRTVGNVLRRHDIPPAPERKRRTTWAEFIRIHLALLAGTDISAAEVLMRGLVACYVLFFIYSESSRIDISRVTNCPNKPSKLRVTRSVRPASAAHCRDWSESWPNRAASARGLFS
jgi:putative transposase